MESHVCCIPREFSIWWISDSTLTHAERNTRRVRTDPWESLPPSSLLLVMFQPGTENVTTVTIPDPPCVAVEEAEGDVIINVALHQGTPKKLATS